MKRFSLILFFAAAAVLSFSSCDEFGDIFGQTDPSFLMIREDPDNPVPIADGDVIEMKVGDYFLPAYTDGHPGWYGLVSDGKCVVDDPSVALFYRGCLYAVQGGETTVTAGYKENEIRFKVSVPKGSSNGTVYFTGIDRDSDMPEEDWEGRIPFSDLLMVNGLLTDKQCTLLASDCEGNLWQGVTKGNGISLNCNGRDLNITLGFPIPELSYIPKEQCLRAKHGKLFYFNGKQYKVISTDGTVADGTAEGNILDMDVDANGSLYLWT